MVAEFKTMTFPSSVEGQQDKIKALEQAYAEGWRVAPEKDGEITVTLKREKDVLVDV